MKKTLLATLFLALLTVTSAWAAPGAPLSCPTDAQPALLLPETTEGANASSWCNIWCPSPPYAMEWNISCEATYCGTTYMSCVGGYSLSCEQCQNAWQYGGPQCYY